MAGEMAPGDGIELKRRIGFYDADGRLEAQCLEIWALIEPDKRRIARAYWERYARSDEIDREISPAKIEELTDRIVPHIEAKHGALSDPRWFGMARAYVDSATKANVSLTTLYSGITACGQAVQDALARQLARDPERLLRLTKAVIACLARTTYSPPL